ncbi:AAA family ATPase [Thermococcus barophilus]|uniref:DNA helicase n=1 Tax=Thermococcus barophilus TaxID=55802 RepID=A0A0S1XEP2_THEBA|nr:minichromosome maintenance protein MCM [Thermococcus barophilus]ALM76228.1 DNA replication licensing factor, MCM2/3/5 family [Thermococcus barophilus]
MSEKINLQLALDFLKMLKEKGETEVEVSVLPKSLKEIAKLLGYHEDDNVPLTELEEYLKNLRNKYDTPVTLLHSDTSADVTVITPDTSVTFDQNINVTTTDNDTISLWLDAIGRTLPKLDRLVKRLAAYILIRNSKISEEELRKELYEFGKQMFNKEYTHESIRQALSAVRNSGLALIKRDPKTGIVYWRPDPEVREQILRTYELLLKEKEIREEQERVRQADFDELVRAAFRFFKDFYSDRVLDLFTVKAQDFLVVDFQKLLSFAPELAERLVEEPEFVIHAFERAVELFQQEEMFRKPEEVKHFKVHFANLGSVIKPSDIRAKHVGKLVEIRALVSSSSDVMSYYVKPVYVCKDDGEEVRLVSESPLDPIPYPDRCPRCGGKNFKLSESLSEKDDLQFFELQDSPEDTSAGQPRRIIGFVVGSQAGILQVGMRVRVTAIVRERTFKKGSTPVYDRVLEVNHIEVLDKAMSANELDERDVNEILSLKKVHGDNLPAVVARSIAPHIYGYEREKLALAVAVVSGVKTPAKSRPHIHVLLVGDPGVAKTELVLDLKKVAPKAIFASGTHATGVGLTATVRRNEFKNGDYVVVGGALVLASGGVAIVDELDKMKPEYRDDLHTAIEQQVIPINKAGITTEIKIDTTVVATANPKGQRINFEEPVVKQLNLKPTLINRFDLVLVMRDNLDDDSFFDGVTDHLIKINNNDSVEREIPEELLRKFFAYARSLKPKFTGESHALLKKEFARLRKTYSSGAFPVNLRYFTALMRISEAIAKLRLSEEVNVNDVRLAVKLLESSFKDVAIDPETGKPDIGLIIVGASEEELVLRDQILRFIDSMSGIFPDGVPRGLIIATFKEKGVDPETVSEFLKHLVTEGTLLVPDDGKYLVRR